MTENKATMLVSNSNDDQSYCTRNTDGVSGMTVTALANFCGTGKPAITQLLNQISDSDPFTNELSEGLKPFAGSDWRLFTNDPSGKVFINDEVCHAVLEYYALEARKYKGKQIAVNNYRMVAKAGLRVFIWSQTGYSPKRTMNQGIVSSEELSATITAALTQALTPIDQRLARIEQRLSALPPAKPSRPWTLSASTPAAQVPTEYIQLEDGSWLSPEAYQSILRQSKRSLDWEVRSTL
jgi:enamine deaminase RidA (YjgF/YER057c/UK114 family)